jgi:hypothetical protein
MSNELLKGPEKRILGGILVAGAVILTHMFVVKPMNEKRAKIDSEASEINKASESALAKIKSIQTMRAEYSSLTNEVFALTNSYVVRQVLGSYPMEQEIYGFAGEVGFSVSSCTELGKTRTPDKPPAGPNVQKGKPAPKGKPQPPPPQHRYDRFQMEVRGTGSYLSVIELIHKLEDKNPFFSVTTLDIAGVKGKPESHNITFKCEWPVDADKLPPPKKK